MKKHISLSRILCIFFLLIITIAVSCSTDEPDPIPSDEPLTEDFSYDYTLTDEKYAELNSRLSELRGVISAYQGNEIDSLVNRYKALENVSEVVYDAADSCIVITLATGYRVNVLLQHFEEDVTPSDAFYQEQEAVADSICSIFDEIENGSMAEAPSNTMDNVEMSRAAAVRSDFLTRRNILLIAPDPQFRNQDVSGLRSIVNKVNQTTKVGKFTLDTDPISAYSATYFDKMKNYDFVYIGCHGTPQGRLIFPSSGMSEEQKKKYAGYAEHPDKSGVELNITGRDVNGVRYDGFILNEKFFKNVFPDLSNTIIWTSKCYSGSNLSELRIQCVSGKKARDYFGATGVHQGSEVLRIFSSYLTFMSQGIDSSEAFWQTDKRAEWLKPLKKCKYGKSNHSHARYPLPRATGVKSTPSRAESEFADPVSVGVQFRYSSDANGNPSYSSIGGVKVTNLNSGYVINIPLTAENTTVEQSHKVGDNIVISDFIVTLSGLVPGEDYSYCAYLEDDEVRVESSESFTFRAPEANTDYAIYTEKDFLFVIQAGEKIKKARLMNDITITEKLGSDDLTTNDYLYADLNGNNHSITFLQKFLDDEYFIRGLWKDVKLCFEIDKKIASENNLVINDGFWLNDPGKHGCLENCTIVNNGSCEVSIYNASTINNCTLQNIAHSYNYWKIANCKFIGPFSKHTFNYSLNHVIVSNEGTIENCTIENLKISNPDYPGQYNISFINSNDGLISDCHIVSGESFKFCNNNHGKIHNCSAKGDQSDSDNSIIDFNEASGEIDGFKSYINFCPINIDYHFSGIVRENEGTIRNVENHGDIKALGECCLICGHNSKTGVINDCSNYGLVEVWASGYDKDLCTSSIGWIEITFVRNRGGKAFGMTNYGSFVPHSICDKHNKKHDNVSIIIQDVIDY